MATFLIFGLKFSKIFFQKAEFSNHEKPTFLSIRALSQVFEDKNQKRAVLFCSHQICEEIAKKNCKNLENCRRSRDLNVENLCENPFRPTRDFRCGQIRVRHIFHKKFKIQSVVVAKCHLIIILPKNYYPEDKKHEKTAIFPFLGFD